MPQVMFFNYAKEINPLIGLQRLITRSPLKDMIPEGESVAVKLHMGELGNIRYIRPSFVRTVVDIVKKQKGKPFLFDTVAAYPGERRRGPEDRTTHGAHFHGGRRRVQFR
jgi:uncharacterized Fe-S center protein